jgi:Leucine-rich repeat (LRR) protein
MRKLFRFTIPILLTLFFLAGSNDVNAQKSKKQPPEAGSFSSLKEAKEANPQSVLKLNLSKKGLKEFPEEVYAFTNLQQLNLSKNKLTSIPEQISTLQKLTFLDISSNKITALPQSIGKLSSLNSFKMSQNKIKELPVSFFHLTTLEIIDFYSNPLIFDPLLFGKLEKNIKYLDVRNTAMQQESCKLLQDVLPRARIKFDKGCNCQ